MRQDGQKRCEEQLKIPPGWNLSGAMALLAQHSSLGIKLRME
jgi:hypothetical protein